MAKKQTIDLIIKTFRELGGNVSDVLGTRTNISFLGVGDNVEPFLDRNLNTEALGILSQSKAIDEAKNAVGFAVSDKLNDIQANNLLNNLNKMKEFYMPPAAPANIVDLGTGTRNLDQEGLASLRRMTDETADIDLPPPGSRGGPDDIAAPLQDAETTIANLEKQDPELAAQFKAVMLNNQGGNPAKRATAREFLVEALKEGDDLAKGKTTLSDVISAEDVKFITEGGGGIGGDPIVLVNKYFGPRIAEALPVNASNEEIMIFTKRVLDNVVDAAGNKPGDPKFNRFTATFIDEMADGGRVGFNEGGGADAKYMFIQPKFLTMKGISEDPSLKIGGFGLGAHDTFYDKFGKFLNPLYYMEKLLEKQNKTKKADGGRVGLRFGKSAGKAFGLAKKLANINKSVDEGTEMGYGALRKYGLEAEDITRLFKELAMDRTLVGSEKTEYFKMLNQVLKNPDDFPDGIIEIKKRLGMDFARGGLAKILEV